MADVSIIIPVYNCASYLPACLDSVLAQTYRDIEIILVEDGSADKSPAICRRYAKKDARIRLIEGSHAGPGAARNRGIRAASGQYLLFVDSDDICEHDLAERLLRARADYSRTLVLCGIQVINESGKRTGSFREDYRCCHVRAYAADILSRWQANPLCGGVYGKLFDLDILRDNNILFEEGPTYGEDFCFNMEYLLHIDGVIILPDLLYRYRLGRKGSLTEKNLNETDFSAIWQRRQDVVSAYRRVYEHFQLTGKDEKTVHSFYWFQAKDMVELAVRRAPDFPAFSACMDTLRENRTEPGSPKGVPAKDRLALRLMLSGHDHALWNYEQTRRKIRKIRRRERG